MSKSNPLLSTPRAAVPTATPTDKPAPATPDTGAKSPRMPQMRRGNTLNERFAEVEKDGALQPRQRTTLDDPADIKREKASVDHWNSKFDDEKRYYDSRKAKVPIEKETDGVLMGSREKFSEKFSEKFNETFGEKFSEKLNVRPSRRDLLASGSPATAASAITTTTTTTAAPKSTGTITTTPGGTAGKTPGTITTTRTTQGNEPSTEPVLQRTGRSGTITDAFRQGFQRLNRSSTVQSTSAGPSFSELAGARWTVVSKNSENADGIPILQLPPKFREALAVTYRELIHNTNTAHLSGDERENRLKTELAKQFLALALSGDDSGFDHSKERSISGINKYLSREFGIKIEMEPLSPRNDAKSPRSPRSSMTSWLPLSPRPAHPSVDFRDQLLMDTALRFKNYQVDRSYDLSNLDADPFAKSVFDSAIENTRHHETVTTLANQRTDVTATFQRDFAHSTYEYEDENGQKKPFTTIDEFVKFIGDPKQAGLPKAVSHLACQNLGVFIKNLLFTRTEANGQIGSPLKLFDGTPIAIAMSPKASYRLSKGADGTVTLHYLGEYDASSAAQSGKNTARLLAPGSVGGVVIDNAKAEITLDIVFKPDGSMIMGKLHIAARGWNQMNGQ